MNEPDTNHDAHDGHDDDITQPLVVRAMRLPSPLTAHAELAMGETIRCAVRVHRELGPGFLESIYRKAMCLELDAAGIKFESERAVSVKYRDVEITGQRVDLVIEAAIIVELKSVVQIDNVHVGQLISYLRTTGLRGGLLINFRVPVLYRGLKRVVL
jgi:GxxExxY protein